MELCDCHWTHPSIGCEVRDRHVVLTFHDVLDCIEFRQKFYTANCSSENTQQFAANRFLCLKQFFSNRKILNKNQISNMFGRLLIRTSQNNLRQYATQPSPLAALRKRTGYSFVNCKKALELHNNDVALVSGLSCIEIGIGTSLLINFICRPNNGWKSRLNRWAGQRQQNWKDVWPPKV